LPRYTTTAVCAPWRRKSSTRLARCGRTLSSVANRESRSHAGVSARISLDLRMSICRKVLRTLPWEACKSRSGPHAEWQKLIRSCPRTRHLHLSMDVYRQSAKIGFAPKRRRAGMALR
jgi:hypothetical protein